MSDSTSFIEHEGFGQRLVKSVGGALLGLGLFFGSFMLLWWNEGNIVEEKAALAEMTHVMVKGNVTKPKASNDGKLLYLNGPLASTERISDEQFLKPGPWLRLDSTVEMYAWVEHSDTKTTKETGGSSTSETTYTYDKEWTSSPEDSSKFKNAQGHANPSMSYQSSENKVSSATFGAYDGMSLVENLRAAEDLKLNKNLLADQNLGTIKNNHFHLKNGSGPDEVGDIRVSYTILKAGEFSVLARQEGENSLADYVATNGKTKFLIESGRHSGQELIVNETNQSKTIAMVLRVVGFAMMWIGAFLFLNPLGTLLDVLPFLGSLGRFAIGFGTFVVAAILSLVTIVVGMIAHNPIVLGIVMLSALGFFGYMWQKKRGNGGSNANQEAQSSKMAEQQTRKSA